MKIIEVNEFTAEYFDSIRNLLCSLMSEPVQFSEADFRELIASDNSHLFLLLSEKDAIAGMVTVGVYRSPSGSKAWIEDVVVDDAYRGRGYGRMLTQHAIDYAKSQKAGMVMLTSNPSRIIANKLHQSTGFERKETNVYRMKLGPYMSP